MRNNSINGNSGQQLLSTDGQTDTIVCNKTTNTNTNINAITRKYFVRRLTGGLTVSKNKYSNNKQL